MKNLYSNLNYFENGDTNKDIIIFLHPKNLSSWIWNNQIDYFDDYHCFYINLDNRTIKENLDLIGNLIETKIKKENITTNKNSNKPQNKINLVGIEFGGQIAIAFTFYNLSLKHITLIEAAIILFFLNLNTL